MRNTAIGIIGFGNMGSAIAKGLKSGYRIIAFDRDKNKLQNLSKIEITPDARELVVSSDVIILAVKPQDFDKLLNDIKDLPRDKLVISIAAGISTAYIQKVLGNIRVVRVMPNIGVKIRESETFLSKGSFASEDDFNFVEELFKNLGKTWKVEERMINPSTAISGSGPAYIFYDIEANNIGPTNIPEGEYIKRLAEAGKNIGINHEIAEDLAVNVTYTSIDLIKKTGLSPAELRKQVSSKGGTTEAAIEVLQNGGSWIKAAEAALKRAKQLSKVLSQDE